MRPRPAITGKTSDSADFTLYGCDSAGGIVTATLKSGGSTVVSDTQKSDGERADHNHKGPRPKSE